MDDIDRKIIDLLSADARRALADIGQNVGLSTSAVNDRLRRLTAQGVIRRFTLEADPEALGLPVLAFVWIALPEQADEAAFRALAADDPAILECHHVTGAWSYLIKLRTQSLAGLEAFLATLKARGMVARSESVLALSSAVPDTFVPKAR
ncbi:Lrp/AsnC family transcriptional regulator [Pararhodobacter marinus]|uniref:Lrp/AsnC family transcriptional regulator n=1 Tax=Pararhodobacter marinus TaxID=2184063 RepID=A0A2U2C9Y9_9RHOB|nr:Lrp/AsnC family transcriptional regulator [Pararhodobacter marinus]PWE28690.1 Lrp/AsnC family transcriptional regulator [Pararhodobacter marinus]